VVDDPFIEVDMFLGRSYYQCLTDVVNRQTATKYTYFLLREALAV